MQALKAEVLSLYISGASIFKTKEISVVWVGGGGDLGEEESGGGPESIRALLELSIPLEFGLV